VALSVNSLHRKCEAAFWGTADQISSRRDFLSLTHTRRGALKSFAVNLSPVVSDQFATGLPLTLTTLAQTLVQIGVLSHRRFGVTTMTRLSRLLYLCVGGVWAGVGLTWLGDILAIWGGSETASAAGFSAVGGFMVATTFTAAVGWFAWKRRNWPGY
jgi:hypothetical protein